MKNIYFDICAIPFFLLILWTCYTRKMTKGHANSVFLIMTWASLVCAVADIAMEFVVNPLPLTGDRVVAGTILSFTYKFVRNAEMVIYLLYVISVTRTEYLLRSAKNRLLLWLPNGILCVLLLQNFFTHNVFSVTAENGYARGPLLIVFYIVAALYGLAGAAYCVYCKRYLEKSKWVALLSIYVLTFVSVGIQMFFPRLLVEMICTAIGITTILLLVMRPEETMDSGVGVQSWKTYKMDLANIVKRQERMQILAMQILNAQEVRTYLGEDRYNALLAEIADEVRRIYKGRRYDTNEEIYIERPGTFYLTLDNSGYDLESAASAFLTRAHDKFSNYADGSIHLNLKACLIRCPDDVREVNDIINLGHKFPQFGDKGQVFFRASEIVQSRDYEIINHMEEILRRAIKENKFEMYYQPIYDNRLGRFASAEALIRLKDEKYGMIPPGLFIPFAETNGLILAIGKFVLEDVFRFIADHNMKALGLSYIEVNLSVVQLLQSDLPETIRSLQTRYKVDPGQVNFEITETLYDNLSTVMDKNVRALESMGYNFSLDDYGVGFSNIQRMSKLPIALVKIDKSLVDEMFTEDGSVIIRNTVRMMQGIRKKLVAEGVETREEIDALSEMSCDHIQGFYYSRPLPADEFVTFLKAHRLSA